MSLDELAEGVEEQADVCLIGAGAAGIAMASTLRNSGLSVILIESGGAVVEAATSGLLDGESVGLPFSGLRDGRARALGGTTRLWAGQCVRLNPMDFEQRTWVPNSGWPLSHDDMEPFYTRAEEFLGVSGVVYDARVWWSFGLEPPAFDSSRILPEFTVYCPETDLYRLYRHRICDDPKVRLLTHANATTLVVDPDGLTVRRVLIRSIYGRSGSVRARAFVLCAGAIENARLLLASDDVVRTGLGNEKGLVGRYFQDHPNGRTAAIQSPMPQRLQRTFGLLYRGGRRFFPKVRLSPEVQRRREVLNCICHTVCDYPTNSPVHALKRLVAQSRARSFSADTFRDINNVFREFEVAVREIYRWYRTGQSPAFPPSAIHLQAFVEQAPNPDSRVLLAEARDELGVRKPKVDWRLTELEKRTFSVITEVVEQDLLRLGYGRCEAKPWLTEKSFTGVADAFHHAGTTRMSDSPQTGVVDSDCRVHGIEGLYVAGGSVFPTSGFANPTLTIIAMSIRLAEHLKTVLKRTPAQKRQTAAVRARS